MLHFVRVSQKNKMRNFKEFPENSMKGRAVNFKTIAVIEDCNEWRQTVLTFWQDDGESELAVRLLSPDVISG